MSNLLKCDRCGAPFEFNMSSRSSIIYQRRMHVNQPDHLAPLRSTKKDLCPICFQELDSWLTLDEDSEVCVENKDTNNIIELESDWEFGLECFKRRVGEMYNDLNEILKKGK